MPKTELQIVATGFEDVISGMEKAAAGADKLQSSVASLGEQQQKSIEGVIKAQNQYNLELVKTGRIVASSNEAKQREQVALSTQEVLAAVKALNVEEGKSKVNKEEIIKKAEELRKKYDQLNGSVKELGGGLVDISNKAKAASDKAAASGDKLTSTASKAATASTAAGNAIADAGIKSAAAQQQLVDSLQSTAGPLEIQRELVKDLTTEIERLSEAQTKTNNVGELAAINRQLDIAKQRLKELKGQTLPVLTPDEAQIVAPIISLREQLRQAEAEAVAARRQFGEISPQFEEAAKKAAILRAELTNTRESIEALNPERKLEAIGQLAQSIAGGFTAVQGALALVGDKSEDVQRALLKVQSVLAITQGLNAFFSGFSSSIKNITLFVRSATGAQAGYAAAQTATAGATAASTEATIAQNAATKTLTTSTKGLTAVLAANPLLSAAAVLGAIAVAMIALGDDSEETTKQVSKLIEGMEKLQSLFFGQVDFLVSQQDLTNQLTFLKSAQGIQEERNKLEGDYQTKIDAGNAKFKLIGEQAQADLKKIQSLRAIGIEEEDKAIVDIKAHLNGLVEDERALNNQRRLDAIQFSIDQQILANKQLLQAQENARERLRIEQQFQKDLLAFQKSFGDALESESISELRAKADQAARDQEFQQEREFLDQITNIQEDQAINALQIKQRELERSLALIELEKKLGVQAIKELGEAELQARLDNLIDSGKVQLDPAQLEQFEVLRNLINARFQRERTKNALEESNKRIKIEDEELKKKLDFVQQEEQLLLARLENARAGTSEFTDILREAGVTDLKNLKTIEQAKLAVSIATAEQQIALLETSGEKADAIKVEQLRKFVTDTKTFLAASSKFSLADFLGITKEELEQLKPLIQQAGQFILGEIQAQFDAQKLANDNYLQSLEDRISATKDAIEREQEARKEGLANNLDAEEEQLKELQKLKEDALKEQEKQAQRQQRLQSVIQLANLGSAIAGLLSNETLKGGVLGLAIAGAAIPILFSLFARAKAQAAASVNQFEEGTRYVKRGKHKRGKDTVPAMLTEGEGVMTREKNIRHDRLLSGIHYDDRDLLRRGMLETASYYGIMQDLAEYFRRKEERKVSGRVDVMRDPAVVRLEDLVSKMDRPRPSRPAINFALPGEMRGHEERAQARKAEREDTMLKEMRRLRESNEALLLHERTKKRLTSHRKGNMLIEQRGDVTTRVHDTSEQKTKP